MNVNAHCELTKVLSEIILEAHTACTDAASTYAHFEKVQANPATRIEGLEMSEVKTFAAILDYDAIRADTKALSDLIITAG
jgi:hypothetical protein